MKNNIVVGALIASLLAFVVYTRTNKDAEMRKVTVVQVKKSGKVKRSFLPLTRNRMSIPLNMTTRSRAARAVTSSWSRQLRRLWARTSATRWRLMT